MQYELYEIPTEDDDDSILRYVVGERVITTRIEETGGLMADGRYHFRALAWEADEPPTVFESQVPTADVFNGSASYAASFEAAREQAINEHLVKLGMFSALARVPKAN